MKRLLIFIALTLLTLVVMSPLLTAGLRSAELVQQEQPKGF